MATGGGDGSLGLLMKEFEAWLEATPDAQIYLLQVNVRKVILVTSYVHIVLWLMWVAFKVRSLTWKLALFTVIAQDDVYAAKRL
jgi:hypothetical protein